MYRILTMMLMIVLHFPLTRAWCSYACMAQPLSIITTRSEENSEIFSLKIFCSFIKNNLNYTLPMLQGEGAGHTKSRVGAVHQVLVWLIKPRAEPLKYWRRWSGCSRRGLHITWVALNSCATWQIICINISQVLKSSLFAWLLVLCLIEW